MWKFNRRFYEESPSDGGASGGPATPPADDPAAPPATPDTTTSITDTPPATPDPADPPANFFSTTPEDWRAQALKSMGLDEKGEDFTKRMKQLERVPDLTTLTKNYFEAQDRIRKGEISTGLPENPTEEQLTEWRAANGIPESPDAYELSLEDGLVLGDADERILGEVFKVAHQHNVPASAMNELTTAMLKGREIEAQARVNQDGIDKQTSDRQLRDAWGGDFEGNINMVRGLVNQMPETVRDAFANARMGDGRAMFNAPEVLVAMAEWSRAINPAATVVPNSANPMQTIDQELAGIKARMGTDEWYKDTAAQKRYRDLLDAKSRMG